MLPATEVINLAEHERAVKVWKEAAAAALNGQEEEREKRQASEERYTEAMRLVEHYADRVADAEQAVSRMAIDTLRRTKEARDKGAVMRAARDLISLNTDAARRQLEQAIAECDAVMKDRESYG